MTQRQRRGRPTREESEAIEERLREAALDAFLADGFDSTTMESIAAAAGITKRTLYARYPDKRTLFAVVLPAALARMPAVDAVPVPPDADLGDALRLIGRAVVERLVHEDAVRLRRLALLEAENFPELASHANERLWRLHVQMIVELLGTHAERGDLVSVDLQTTADLFFSMVCGGPTILSDFGVVMKQDDITCHVDNAVELFLSGVRPRPRE